jgi:transcription-repair coupling factor (superfamily II helicase)
MKLSGLLGFGQQLPAFRDLVVATTTGKSLSAPLGIYHAARPYVVAMLAQSLNRPLVVITARSNRARQWVDELRIWLPDEVPVHFFADGDALPYERISWAPETRQRRLESLVGLLTSEVAMLQSPYAVQRTSPDTVPVPRGQTQQLAETAEPNLERNSSPDPTVRSGANPGGGALRSQPVVVASARALMQKTLPVREMRAVLRPIRQGQPFDLNKALTTWVGLAYESAAVVESPGQFSRRGGIIDIWPPNLRRPLRIELFGDEIDSLRSFDPSTQRTASRLVQAWIGPASEALPKLGERVAERLRALNLASCHPPARIEFESELSQLIAGGGFRNLEWYIPYLYSQPGTLLDYLPDAGWILVDDAAELLGSLADLEGQAEQLARDLTAAGDIPGNATPPCFTFSALHERLATRPSVLLSSSELNSEVPTQQSPYVVQGRSPEAILGRSAASPMEGSREMMGGNASGSPVLQLDPATSAAWRRLDLGEEEVQPMAPLGECFMAGPRFGGQVRTAADEIKRAVARRERVVVVSRQTPRLAELWEEAGYVASAVENAMTLPPPGLTLVQGVMEEGWGLRSPDVASGRSPDTVSRLGFPSGSGLWFLTDAEIFGWGKPKPRRPQRPRAVAPEVFFADVSVGDYVVHIEHGIGQFEGLVKMILNGVEREYLQVDYAQGDRLYVPVHQADRLARYVGVGDTAPAMHRLGSSDWEQVKARAKRAVAEIAGALLELYAAREVVRGHAFSPDATWQAELESSFPYVETEDQLVAIEAVKHDMEQTRPMDRLICGDVGYGKTEVALRAAFKAIMDGKQVAVLVPTTVLAQQHYTNFSRRLAAFPVNVAMLSRFQTPAQQERILRELISGTLDLVVGTHRLLSKDVAFRDLGLLIVDEEQRFGVSHKERIKQLRTEVDVLTLTATPIPRTLHMSLTGLRDLSTIETPPEERLPIKTFVGEFDESLIRQAVLRELDRNGQVYFVHNRVQGIEQVAARISRLIPEASVAIAHGQMPERDLSAVMLTFADGEYDILVCTSIIESGLDIPNVNTIIINRADQFGLAQLYQLRGRVGRSAVRAYAYLLVDKYKTLTEDSRRRLEAIQEANELSAGFRIAMQDLEIRGAGELLGARQHGHIAAVGFDLYTRLLAQAVQEARERLKESSVPARSTDAAQAQRGAVSAQSQGFGDLGRGPDPSMGTGGGSGRNLLEDPLAPTVTLDLNLPARIPESYVPDATLRLQLYRRLAGLTTVEGIEEISQEFTDRFGPIPEQVQNLLYIVRVKVLAINAGIEAIGQEEEQLLIKSAGLERLDRAALLARLTAQGVPARVARRGIWLDLRVAERPLQEVPGSPLSSSEARLRESAAMGRGPSTVSGWQQDLIKTLETIRQSVIAQGADHTTDE